MEFWREHVGEIVTALTAVFKGGTIVFGRRFFELVEHETGKALIGYKVIARDRAVGRTNAFGKIHVPIHGLTELQVYDSASGTRCEIRLSSDAPWGFAVTVDPALMYRGEILRVFVRTIHA